MARQCASASGEYFDTNFGGFLSQTAFTISFWIYFDSLTGRQSIYSNWQAAGTNRCILIRKDTDNIWDVFATTATSGQVGGGVALSVSATTWYNFVVTWDGTTIRPYQNASAGTTYSMSGTTGSSMTSTPYFGDSPHSSNLCNAQLAELAVWEGVALDTAEVAGLADGYSALHFRPASLSFYAPMVRDADRDIIGGAVMTANGTPTVTAHPRIIYPRRTRLTVPSAAVAASGNPWYYYASQAAAHG